MPEPYGLNIRDTGAAGDGSTDDSHAIQKALDSGQPLITAPPGCYRIGRTLRIGSNTRFIAHPQARFVMADGAGVDRACHLLANADPDRGNANVHVEGGIWDGNNRHNPRGPDAPDSYTGIMLCFTQVEGLTLRDVTLIDPESYYCRIDRTRRFWIEDIRLRATNLRPNQDGVHLGGHCEDGIIRRIDGSGEGVPNDDLVAINPNDANDRAQNLGKTWGPVRRIDIDGLTAECCHSFVRLLSVDDVIEQVTMANLFGGCRVAALNLDAGRQCKVPPFDSADPKYARGAGLLRNIRIWNARVHKAGAQPNAKPLIHLMTNVDDLTVERFGRDEAADAALHVPTLGISDVGPTRVELEGLTRAQAEAIDLHQPTTAKQIDPCASPTGQPRHRMTCAIDTASQLALPHGGFDRLALMRDNG